MSWSQVDLKEGTVRLEPGDTKNHEPRTVYLDDELRAILIRQWNSRQEAEKVLPYVFLNEGGTDRIKRFGKAWKSACKDAGIGVKLFENLRRIAVKTGVSSARVVMHNQQQLSS